MQPLVQPARPSRPSARPLPGLVRRLHLPRDRRWIVRIAAEHGSFFAFAPQQGLEHLDLDRPCRLQLHAMDIPLSDLSSAPKSPCPRLSAFHSHDEPMAVPEELSTAVQHLLPLRIRAVEFQDPMVSVIGDRWSLALVGPWAWRRTGGVAVDWRAYEAEHVIWELCGLDVIDVVPGNGEPTAVCFELSDGSALAALPDETTYELWTFRHDDLPVVFVGLP